MGVVYDRNLTIRSVIENLSDVGLPEGEPEITEVKVPGLITVKDACLLITYRENTEGGAVFSTVKIEDDTVSVQRRGAISFDMHFGEADECGIYRIEPYAFDYQLHTLKIRKEFERAVGKLDIFYELRIGGAQKKVCFSLCAEAK